ncbi:pyrroline-5-carboxylate reductase [Scatolibacter rhodanostii]|uniref:pyrroline-5-carboxylate reductase n=1 Tax=Scatolibacter rhodanostii TaxID=2014781 RepID=UPI000C07DDD8|nr:pyrroline-5-carboxylate reductase [Scatolibacter rhodanostii]
MKLGFIGCGNMASAIVGGILNSNLCAPADITASDVNAAARDQIKEKYGIQETSDNKEVVSASEIIFLAIKPQFTANVLSEIAPFLTSNHLLISIVAGKGLDFIGALVGNNIPVIRTMPNTPALVGEAMTALSPNENVTPEMLETAQKIISSFGKSEVIPEHLMPAVVGVSGSSPAYIFMLIEAMADSAVAEGMPRSQAYTFAAQSVLGSAKMVLESGIHPAALKDMVCSPAGTTIEAVKTLEETGMRSSIMKAVHISAEKSRNL